VTRPQRVPTETGATLPAGNAASSEELHRSVGSVAVFSLHTSPLAQPGTGDSGGMNVAVRGLSAALAQAGVDVRVLTRADRAGLPARVRVEPGFEVVHLPAGPIDLRKEDLTGVLGEFTDAAAAELEASPADVLHAHYWLSGVAAHQLKHRLGLPLVTTFHTLARVKGAGGDHEPSERAEAEQQVMGCSDAVTVSNPVEAHELLDHYEVPVDRLEIVPPGVDHAFFSPGDRRGARAALAVDDRPTLLFVGRIQPLKGLPVAIEALARLRGHHARLVVIGGPSGPDGPSEWDRCHDLARRCGVQDRVEFVPPQPHHLLSSWYRAADAVVMPSRSEAFGLVALEAAACGVPVVAGAVGGLQSLVEDGRTGFLVDPRDPAALADRLQRLLDDPVLAAAVGSAAADRARGYSWSTTAARLRRLYADLRSRSLVECR
jgi:D-inositol-3-phosphate glycosyltransferase